MGEQIHVEIPIRTVSVMNTSEHHMARARRAKAHRQAAHWSLVTLKKPALPCMVTLTRIAPRPLDGDNLQSALKALRDGVADWLGVDDRDPRVTWNYGQRAGKPKTYSVLVTIGAAA